MRDQRLFLARVGLPDRWRHRGEAAPVGLLSLAAYLRSRLGIQVRIVDQRVEDLTNEAVVKEAAAFGADFVGFSAMTVDAGSLPFLTASIRQALPSATIALGGPHVSAVGPIVLKETSADVAVRGEGERSLEQVIEACVDGGDLAKISGLIWRGEDGEVVVNPGCPPCIEDLDTLPFLAYDLMDLKKLWRLWSMAAIPRRRYISLFSSRGCPFACCWCHNSMGRAFRAQSAERVVGEIEHFVKTLGVNDIGFLDDVFNLDRQRTLDICSEILRRGLKVDIGFDNGLRCDLIDEEMMEALCLAGMRYTLTGLETASPRLQKWSRKRLDLDRYHNFLEMAARKRIFLNGMHILGLPTETEEEIQATIDAACDSPLHTASFSIAMPFPNTPLWEYTARTCPEKLANIGYADFDFYYSPVNVSGLPDKVLFDYQRRANRRFYLNPRRLARIARDMPKPYLFPSYLPYFLARSWRPHPRPKRLSPTLQPSGLH